jgi:AcrR family transcriptional regulator
VAEHRVDRRGELTRATLLLCGERLFACSGIQGTSTRRITTEAGTNSDALHYHFGSKAGLVATILGRRIDQLRAQQERILTVSDVNLAIPLVARAMVEPAVMMAEGSDGGQYYHPFLAAVLSDPQMRHLATKMPSRWTDLLMRSLEQLTPWLTFDEQVYRLSVCGHLVIHALGDGPLIEWASYLAPGLKQAPPGLLIDVIVGILSAPTSRDRPTERRATGRRAGRKRG